MKPKYLILIIIILAVFLIGFCAIWLQRQKSLMSDDQLKFCNSDSDCVTAESVCEWDDGTKICCQTTINQKYKNYWLKEIVPKQEKCESLIGGPHESYLRAPACTENKCELSKTKPMGAYYCNKKLDTFDFEKGPPYGPLQFFGFWTLNEKTEHILQVDDDKDFSSPLIEKSLLPYSSETIESLEKGTYYWRVKDTESDLWSDVCYLTIE